MRRARTRPVTGAKKFSNAITVKTIKDVNINKSENKGVQPIKKMV